jgi:hypothetical protein
MNKYKPAFFYTLASVFFGLALSPFIYFFYLTFKAAIQ